MKRSPGARLRHDSRGAVAMEFALIATILVGAIVFLIDIGNLVQQRIQVQSALRAGGSYAQIFPGDLAGTKAAILATLPASWAAAATVPTPVVSCECPSYTACASGSSPCSSGQTAQYYMRLSITLPYSPLMSAITSSSASYVVRTQ